MRERRAVLHRRQRHQGGAMATVGETDGRCLDINGGLPGCRSHRRMAWLAASRTAGPTSAVSGLLRIAGRDGVEITVGRRFRLSRVNWPMSAVGQTASSPVALKIPPADPKQEARGSVARPPCLSVRLLGSDGLVHLKTVDTVDVCANPVRSPGLTTYAYDVIVHRGERDRFGLELVLCAARSGPTERRPLRAMKPLQRCGRKELVLCCAWIALRGLMRSSSPGLVRSTRTRADPLNEA